MTLTTAQSETDPIAAQLRWILRGLLAVFGNWRALDVGQSMAFHWRVSHMHVRLERLWLRFKAGKLRPTTTRAAEKRTTGPRKPAVLMPRKWGWMLAAGKHHAGYYTFQFSQLLTKPEMMEFLEAAPQARAMLRPVCRAFGVDLPWVLPPTRTPKPPKPRKPRPKPEPFRTKLPRGVISWARREKRLERARAEINRILGRA